jgi:hypothetical protein
MVIQVSILDVRRGFFVGAEGVFSGNLCANQSHQ